MFFAVSPITKFQQGVPCWSIAIPSTDSVNLTDCPVYSAGLPDIKKNFYVEDPNVARMSDLEVCDFR